MAIGRGLTFGSNLLLARLLTAGDFGAVAFAMLLINAFALVQDLGVPAAVINSGRDPKRILGTALSINLATSTLLFAATILVAPYLAQLGRDDRIARVAWVLAIGLIATAISEVQSAVIVKELRFRRKFVLDVGPVVGAVVASVVFALLGLGVWALVVGYVVRLILSMLVMACLAPFWVFPTFDRSVAGELVKYGRHVSATGILSFIVLNIDYFIIGKFLTVTDLGHYTVAFMLGTLPAMIIAQVAKGPLFAVYSRLRDDPAALASLFDDTLTILSTLAIPVGLLGVICAPTYVLLVLGEKWMDAIVPLQVLTVYSVILCIRAAMPALMKATGRPDVEWKLMAFYAGIVTLLMLGTVHFGIVAVAVSHVAAGSLNLIMIMAISASAVGISARHLGRLVGPQIIAVTPPVLIVAALVQSPFNPMTASPLSATALAFVSIAGYLALAFKLNPRLAALAEARLPMLLARMKSASRPSETVEPATGQA